MTLPIVIGESSDPHVGAVVAALARKRVTPTLLSIRKLQRDAYGLSGEGLTVSGQPVVSSVERVNGWIRRLAPSTWRHDPPNSDLDRVERAAWIEVMLAVSQSPQIRWLSRLRDLDEAENKIVQYRTAEALGLAVPTWFVGSDGAADKMRDDHWILKPLGPAEFFDADGDRMQVFAAPVSPLIRRDGYASLATTPFIVQKRVSAKAHLRVVTVADQAWVAWLDAPVELDWRKVDYAHEAFTALDQNHPATPQVVNDALELANELELGFSSQDWIWDGHTAWVVDLNPSGQWGPSR